VSHVLQVIEGATPGPAASDVNGMRIKILTASALATLSVAGTAAAQTPQPVPQEALDRPVAVDVSILDAQGATVGTLGCEWSVGGPGDDDRPCLKFQADPQEAFGAIESAGGVRAEQRTVVGGDAAGEMAITYSKRADGTWLIRSKGTVRGRYLHFGRVCTADGQKCVRWDAGGATHARKDVRAAASKLRRR
jgi:hypothetical protein